MCGANKLVAMNCPHDLLMCLAKLSYILCVCQYLCFVLLSKALDFEIYHFFRL